MGKVFGAAYWNPKVGGKRCRSQCGGASVEAIVVTLVSLVTLALVALAMFNRDDDNSKGPLADAQQRPHYHQAADVPATAMAERKPVGATNQNGRPDTFVYHGITIVSPPLLIPVINLDEVRGTANLSITVGSPTASRAQNPITVSAPRPRASARR